MQTKENLLLQEYRNKKPDFERLEIIVADILQDIMQSSSLHIYNIMHRIKTEQSLAGKLQRKGDKYATLSDITDILGARVVCYFSDEVDALTKCIESRFTVNWEKSIDKRKYLNFNTFGYLSVHYICSLKDDGTYPPELTSKSFEIQMCSMMQHIWAVLEHDLGYKTKFGIPNAVRRDFSRLAGLLEIADEHVVRIRDNVSKYTKSVHEKIINDNAHDIQIDTVSLNEYIDYSKNMRSFLQTISNVCEAEIYSEKADSYLEQLAWLKKNTLGDLQNMLEENSSLALRMIEKQLAMSELDILSSTIAIRFLCRAELIHKQYTQEQIMEFFLLSMEKKRAERAVKQVFELK
ncbi:MAG: hypothetical protein IJP62_00845 [Treponema sp.]|nr:hypothetical protein [Treponema sp.]